MLKTDRSNKLEVSLIKIALIILSGDSLPFGTLL